MSTELETYQNQVSKLYIAFFGRVPEADGFNFWVEALANGAKVSDLAAGFAGSQEFETAYGDVSAREAVSRFYENTLNREADPEGLDFWASAVDDSTPFYDIANAIISTAFAGGPGVNPLDQALVENKVAVAKYVAVTLASNDPALVANALEGVSADPASVQGALNRLQALANADTQSDQPADPPQDAPTQTGTSGGGGGGGGGTSAPINPTYTFNTGDVTAGDTVTLSTSVTDTFNVQTTTDFDALNGGESLTGLDVLTIAQGQTAKFLSAQVTGLTLAVNGQGDGTATLRVDASSDAGETLDLGNATVTNARPVLNGGAGNDNIVGTSVDDTITAGGGADSINGGEGFDRIVFSGNDLSADDTVDGGNVAGANIYLDITTEDLNAVLDLDHVSNLNAIQFSNYDSTSVDEINLTLDPVTQYTGTVYIEANTVFNLPNNVGVNLTNSAATTATTFWVRGSDGNDVLQGSNGNDTLIGDEGADTLSGAGGDDTFLVYGTTQHIAADSIDGGTGNNTIRLAGVDNDQTNALIEATFDLDHIENVLTIEVADGANREITLSPIAETTAQTVVIDGSSLTAPHTLSVDNQAASASTAFSITGGAGADTLAGSDGNDTLTGGAGADEMDGGAGDDEIDGGTGADSLMGGNGEDTLISDDTDTIDGEGDTDTAVFAAAVSAANLLDADMVNVENVVVAGAHTFDFSVQTEALNITGDLAANIIKGGAGADTLTGGAGDDSITGDAGSDTIEASVGADTLSGGDGTDTLRLVQTVNGTFIDNAAKIDIGASASTEQTLSNGNTITIDGFENIDASDQLSGSVGLELTGTSGRNTLRGGDGADTLEGQDGSDILEGNGGADSILGGNGDDSITGELGNDTINGGAGADRLTGGVGADRLTGGLGVDQFNVDAEADDVTDFGVGGADRVYIANTATLAAAVTADYTAAAVGDIDNQAGVADAVFTVANDIDFDASAATDTTNGITITATGNAAASNLVGTNQADIITGGRGADTLTGGNGADTIEGDLGADRLIGNDGNDVFVYSSKTELVDDTTVDGGTGLDNIRMETGNFSLTLVDEDFANVANMNGVQFVSSNNVTMTAGGNVNDVFNENGIFISTGDSVYSLNFDGSGLTILSTINGSDRDDLRAGHDTLTGGSNQDVINGRRGSDTMTGGAGVDTFVQGITDSFAADTTIFAGGTVAVGDSFEFRKLTAQEPPRVDVITDFTAGTNGDALRVLVAGAPTTLIGATVANLTGAKEVFFASGGYDTTNGVFTIAADGAGADTLIVQADNAVVASDALTTNASMVVLVGVDSDNLVAGNFVV